MEKNRNGNYERGAANGIGGLTKNDPKELEKFSHLLISRKDALTKQRDMVKQMDSVGHWWDAKVPDMDINFYNFVSLATCTDKRIITQEIQKYETFNAELQRAIKKFREAARDNNDVDADEILMLYDKLSHMIEEAESGKMITNSSTLHKIHSEFLSAQESLESKLKRVECVALRQQLKQVTRAWKQALNEVADLKREMQEIRVDNKEMKEQLNSIIAVNEEMVQNQKVLLDQNKLMRDVLEKLINQQI